LLRHGHLRRPGSHWVGRLGSDVRRPPANTTSSYAVDLSFSLPDAGAFREKVLYTALIACGRSKYVQPIRPLVTKMSRVPALTVQPSSNPTSLSVPHLFGGIRSYGEATRTVSCGR
jgi:hypothetical protein